MGVNDHALGLHFAHQRLAQHRVEVGQQMILADEQLDLGAELMKRARQLAGDIAAARDRDALRPPLELKKSVRRDAQLRSRQRRHDRYAAGGDHDVRRREALAVRFQGMRIDEPGRALHVLDALGGQIARIDAVQTHDVRIAPLLQYAPIVVARGNAEAVIVRVLEREGDARRVPHHLFRDTADVHTGPAQPPGLDHRGPRAVLRRALGTGEAPAAAADADEIESFGRHCELHPQGGPNPDDTLAF